MDYEHLSPEQVQRIREAAIQVYATGDGGNDVPGEEAARAALADESVEVMLAMLPDDPSEYLDFDPDTGEAWDD